MLSFPSSSARAALITLLLVCVTACAPRMTAQRPEVPDGDKCLQLYAQVDARIDKAGVRDAGYYRIPGFPYLRSDRYSASFVNEIPSLDAFWEWVGYLRANEDEAREVELRNLGMSEEQASTLLLDLRGCGGWLRSWELEDETFRKALYEVVVPPDEYSLAQRAFGFYPLAVPFLKRGLAEYRREVREQFETPLEQLPAPGEPMLWTVKPNPQMEYPPGTIDLRNKPRDLLGRIGLLWSEVVHLAYTHAPAMWIPTAGDFDRPGMPMHTPAGPDVDVQRPVVHFLPGLTRFGGRSLLQISYFVWFSERLPEHRGDGAAGVIDGLIWRVTLDEQGLPLFYDTIHACGCYHYGFAAQPLQVRDEQALRERMLMPQKDVPTGEAPVLRLASGTHALQRLVPAAAAGAGKPQGYELRPYDELMNLPHPGGGMRSLFDPDGFIAGTERSERFWLWPSGVRSPGAMRQWGRHATAFVGRAHFDDPFLLDAMFVAPDPAPVQSPVSSAPAADGASAARN